MEFLKKHYEKIILSVVLLGLAAVAATLPLKVKQEKDREEERKSQLIGAAAKPLPDLDLSTNKAVLEKVKTPIKFDIAGKHNLFNPVTWRVRPDGALVKVNEIGVDAMQVTAITPLQMTVTFDAVLGSTNEPKYQITVVRETEKSPKQSRAMAKGGVSNIGSIKDVIGPADNPTQIVFQLPDRTEVTVSKDKPFTKTIGYAADLVYPPSNNWSKKGARKGDPIVLGNETYNIVYIGPDTVTFQAKSNQKQTPKSLTK
jgi:rRNA processing protein Gar1